MQPGRRERRSMSASCATRAPREATEFGPSGASGRNPRREVRHDDGTTDDAQRTQGRGAPPLARRREGAQRRDVDRGRRCSNGLVISGMGTARELAILGAVAEPVAGGEVSDLCERLTRGTDVMSKAVRVAARHDVPRRARQLASVGCTRPRAASSASSRAWPERTRRSARGHLRGHDDALALRHDDAAGLLERDREERRARSPAGSRGSAR